MIGYPALELLYRGRTHPAMALAGGVSLAGLKALCPLTSHWPLWKAGLLGSAGITVLEYRLGRRFNRRHQIWDYRRLPLNVRGAGVPAVFGGMVGIERSGAGGNAVGAPRILRAYGPTSVPSL